MIIRWRFPSGSSSEGKDNPHLSNDSENIRHSRLRFHGGKLERESSFFRRGTLPRPAPPGSGRPRASSRAAGEGRPNKTADESADHKNFHLHLLLPFSGFSNISSCDIWKK